MGAAREEFPLPKRNPIFKYIGSKARLAPLIARLLPDHECYVEVFGGTASVLVVKPRSPVEVYNDINEDLVNFFRVLRDRPWELVAAVMLTPYSRAIYEEVRKRDLSQLDPVLRAAMFFYRQNASTSGFKSGFSVSPRPDEKKAWEYLNKVISLVEFSNRFFGVIIECLDFRDVIKRYDRPGTVSVSYTHLTLPTTERV